MSDLIEQGIHAGKLRPDDPQALQLLLVAVMQGVAALVAWGRITDDQGDALIAEATTLLIRDRRPIT